MQQTQAKPVSTDGKWVSVASASEVFESGCKTVYAWGYTIALFKFDRQIYAVDNRCPHMGFPLDKGNVREGILTCHWHHARFDLASGGTFDLWADDVRAFPVKLEDGLVWLDLTPLPGMHVRYLKNLSSGLERNIRLVIAKATLGLLSGQANLDTAALEPFRAGLKFAATNRRGGWSIGATTLAVMQNLLPHLDEEDKPRALFTGLNAVSRDCDGQPARFAVEPLPDASADIALLKKWFRQFIEVRDSEGAERCIVTAVRAGYSPAQVVDIFYAAATDHRYIDIGHPLDFTTKAFEALDLAGWDTDLAAPVLASLVPNYTGADRMEESNEWRHPIDLVALLENTFGQIEQAAAQGAGKEWRWHSDDSLIDVLLGDDPVAIVTFLLEALRQGATYEQLAGIVAYTALRRIVHYGITNEYPDWNTVHHTFTFANAVHMGMRRAPSVELVRGVFDAALSIYLDRFLNIPPTRLPAPLLEQQVVATPDELLKKLFDLFNLQQQVNEAAELVALYLNMGGAPDKLRATLGKALLREDAGFHPIQSLEACFRQYAMLLEFPGDPKIANHALLAAVRYLAAHSPTARSANQTYQIALRLNRGEKVFEE
ncbi:MAG: Rieske (2Fe-2S) protein [Chloroflexi bacterium]|uniref:Rieske (2Fe-2S) protein n=1 Tax=Candidatus Chlorohelix allophototropha TaxID=3003348 RepID=A0A8T7M7K4_9CHLR|nr:Rieske (2Fe-2S) protein [Chloroflexota bacterium]WJW69898.1 Rieske (2Fe-2S) protein [Chloroflexota bacterium L227-S17]